MSSSIPTLIVSTASQSHLTTNTLARPRSYLPRASGNSAAPDLRRTSSFSFTNPPLLPSLSIQTPCCTHGNPSYPDRTMFWFMRSSQIFFMKLHWSYRVPSPFSSTRKRDKRARRFPCWRIVSRILHPVKLNAISISIHNGTERGSGQTFILRKAVSEQVGHLYPLQP